MNINFKLLGTFLSVAENFSFRKAADQTNRSLPAVSMQIKQLEEQLGVALFHRTTRKVELTDAGERLLISARRALAELEGGLTEIQQQVDVQQGRVSLACVSTICSSRLPMILSAFAKRYPGIAVHLRELPNKDLLEAVRRREVDFAIGSVPERKGELDFAPIFVDEYCALLPKRHLEGDRATISWRELSKMPLLKLASSTAFWEDVVGALRSNELRLESNFELTHVNTMIAMADAGLGVALLPRIALPLKSSLKALRITGPAISRTISIITIKGHSLSPAASRLVDLCNEMVAPPTA